MDHSLLNLNVIFLDDNLNLISLLFFFTAQLQTYCLAMLKNSVLVDGGMTREIKTKRYGYVFSLTIFVRLKSVCSTHFFIRNLGRALVLSFL